MQIALISDDPHTIKQARSLFRRKVGHSRLTLRNGKVYTMRYNPGIQPRTECQEKSWSLFKEANRRVAEDFADPHKKARWQRLQKEQSQYKTARGLARAHYMSALRLEMQSRHQDKARANQAAASSLHIHRPTSPGLHHGTYNADLKLDYLSSSNNISWSHHRNVHWWRSTLHSITLNGHHLPIQDMHPALLNS